LLAQFAIDLERYHLADAYLDDSTAKSSGEDLIAASYAAYGRWQADDVPGALARLEQLATTHPQNLHLRAMLVLAYLEAQEHAAARQQIERMVTLAPYHSDTHIAQAALYLQQSEYLSATLKYRQAFFSAPEQRKGHYALLGARFHLQTNFGLCNDGLEMADLAVRHMPDDAEAWTVLAASRYRCREFDEALGAAETALAYNAGAEAAYYLGAALAGLHDYERARPALIRAADLAPASLWRQRAEQMLLDMP
jgi:tetratricopeptide (TPR) repeat protein